MAGDGKERTDQSIQNSLLTPALRKFLQSNASGEDANTYRARVRKRIGEGIKDLRIIADHLEERDRDLIFDARPRTREYNHLQRDVQAAIAFFYAGLGGEPGFREPLRWGVADGEVMLGNIDNHLDIQPRFAVDVLSHVDDRETAEAIEAEEWDRLSPQALFRFVQLAKNNDALDFERIYERIDYDDETREWAESHNEQEGGSGE